MQNILKQTIGSFLNILCGLGSSPGTFSNSAWGLCMGWPAGLWGGRWATKPAFRGGGWRVSATWSNTRLCGTRFLRSHPCHHFWQPTHTFQDTRCLGVGAGVGDATLGMGLGQDATSKKKKNSQSSPGCRSRRCRPWGRRLRGGNRPPRRCRCPAGREDWGGPPVAEYPRPTPC